MKLYIQTPSKCWRAQQLIANVLASLDRRSENVLVHPVIVAELELGNRHKG